MRKHFSGSARRAWILAPAGLAFALALVPAACGPSDDGDDDAGIIDDGDDGCGSVTAEGFCTGDQLTYCDEDVDELVEVDCADALSPRDATCIEVSAEYGSDCAVADGEDCLADDGTILFCSEAGSGCLDAATGIECTADLGTCTPADEGSCDGQLLLSVCAVNQPFIVDCDAYGGTCSEADGACRMEEGEFCDDVDFVCAPGLSCGADNSCG